MDRNVFLHKQLSAPIADFSGWSMKPDNTSMMEMFGRLLASGFKRSRAEPFQGRCVINKEYSSLKKRMRRMRRFGDLGWEK